MSMNFQQLAHPESMSESVLLEILKSRCIEIPNVKIMKKSDLIEIFKRVAFPMPQRRYNETKLLGKKLNDLRLTKNISVAIEEEQALYESAVSSQKNVATKSNNQCLRISEESSPSAKKICLSNTFNRNNGCSENGLKHKLNNTEDSAQKEVKKRQKITWP